MEFRIFTGLGCIYITYIVLQALTGLTVHRLITHAEAPELKIKLDESGCPIFEDATGQMCYRLSCYAKTYSIPST
jgi:hypothetical protein